MRLPITVQRARQVLTDQITSSSLSIVDGRVAKTVSPGTWRLDLPDHLIFPGLINTHDHLQLNHIPCLPAPTPFPNSYAWMVAFQSYFREPAVAAARRIPAAVRYWHGGLKNLLSGVTTVAHHDPWHSVLDGPVFPTRLLRRFGWSHSLGLGTEVAAASRASSTWAAAQFDGAMTLLPRYGPAVTESFRGTPADQPWILHLAEGTDDVAAAELAQLDALGCLTARTILVHGVGLSAADISRVIERGAGVIWCPSSNLSILGRTLDPQLLFDHDRLTLGSDSRLTGSFDLLAELRVAAAHSDLAPRELLHLVTTAASRMLGMPDIGGLGAGQHADLVIVRDTGGDPYLELLNLQRGDIRAVICGGVPAIADPDFADWFALCDTETVPVQLDGRPKLLARRLAWLDAVRLEPQLECRQGVVPHERARRPAPSHG